MNPARSDYFEIERLRNELYRMVNGVRELHHHEVCELSTQLDKLIVKHMEMLNNQKKSYAGT